MTLTERLGDAIDVVVDACQARLGPDAVAAYLARGWLVQMTGSKFWGGPPFSGALLVPATFQARQIRLAPLLASLTGYMARGEWPAEFGAARDSLPERTNLGLITRWRAAVAEVDQLSMIDSGTQILLARRFADLVTAALEGYPELLAVCAVPLDRSALCPSDPWSGESTIIPVIPTQTSNDARRLLTLDEVKVLHRQLAAKGLHVGQPVKIGTTAALRLCASGRTLLAMAERGGIERTAEDLATVFSTLSDLLHTAQ
jgi:hypothetical protein